MKFRQMRFGQIISSSFYVTGKTFTSFEKVLDFEKISMNLPSLAVLFLVPCLLLVLPLPVKIFMPSAFAQPVPEQNAGEPVMWPAALTVEREGNPPAGQSMPMPAGIAMPGNVVPPAGLNMPVSAGSGMPSNNTVPLSSTPVVKPELSRWLDKNRPIKAAILCIHGLGLNSNSYQDFGNLMAHKGYAVYALDVRGFGEWMKANGKARINFDKTLLDIQNGLKLIHSLHPGLPVIILGESMGGAIALRAAAEYPDLIQGLVSSVPAGDRFKQADTSISVFLHALKGMKKDFDEGDKVIDQATDNAQLRAAWRNDPLDRLEFSPEDLLQFQQFMNGNHAAAKKVVNKPVVFFQGQADRLVKPQGTEKLFAEIGSPSKAMIVLGSCEHLIFEEAKYTKSIQAFDFLETWLNANLALNAN